MKKSAKIWLIIASLLVIVGAVMFAVSLIAYNGDFTKFATAKYQTNMHEISEEFTDISIDTETADIKIFPSDDNKCKVVCYETEKESHSVEVENGTLKIRYVDTRAWYEYIGINISSSRITVYLPEKEYSSLKIKGSTGNVYIPADFSFDSIDIKASTGDVHIEAASSESIKIKADTGDINLISINTSSLDLGVSTGKISVTDINCGGDIKIEISTGKVSLRNISCKNLISSGDTGKITLKNVTASEKFSITRSTGDVTFDACDASEILVSTSTGDVRGTLLSGKVFVTDTSTGKTDVPKSTSGGICEITTSTGDIEISITE
ncbi:MAG: DUF4097 domain-containing protein [Ruminococcaceae bacterium]|nr:DUF4097 domain-containing protein [Oscillospiraceae bacterium]